MRETLRVTGEIPHIIFKELSWPHKRDSIRIHEMKRAFDTKKVPQTTFLIILFLPTLADLKVGRIWGKESERTGHTLPHPLPIPVSTISQT